MKRLAAFCFVLLMGTSTVFGEETKALTVSQRSQRYEMTVTVDPLPSGQVAYEVVVKDLSTQTVVAQPRATDAPDANVDLSAENNGTKFAIHIRPHTTSLGASLVVERDGAVIDHFTTYWSLPLAQVKHLVAPGALRVGGNVKAPIVISRVEPIYTAAARKDRIAGVVIVEVVIDKNGNVADAMVMKDLPDGLGQAAVDAVRQWKFKPGMLNGEPVDVIFNLTANFSLNSVKPQP